MLKFISEWLFIFNVNYTFNKYAVGRSYGVNRDRPAF